MNPSGKAMQVAISVPRNAMPMVSSMALTRSQNASPGVGGNIAPAILTKRSIPFQMRAGEASKRQRHYATKAPSPIRTAASMARCIGVRENARG